MNTHVIELTGAAGCGKSALIRRLQQQDLFYAGPPRGRKKERVVPYSNALVNLARAGWKPRLRPDPAQRLFRRAVRVERGVRWEASLNPGLYVIDEGPLRTLADMAWLWEKDLAVWREYARLTLDRLATLDINIVVCRVRANRQTRFDRRKKRGSENRKREKDGLLNAASFEEFLANNPDEQNLRFLGNEVLDVLQERMPERTAVVDVDNSGNRSLDAVADEFVEKLVEAGAPVPKQLRSGDSQENIVKPGRKRRTWTYMVFVEIPCRIDGNLLWCAESMQIL